MLQAALLTPVLGAMRSLLAVLMSSARGLALLTHHSAECMALMAALDPAEAGQVPADRSTPPGCDLVDPVQFQAPLWPPWTCASWPDACHLRHTAWVWDTISSCHVDCWQLP